MSKAPVSLFPFVAGAYRARSLNFDAQRTVNLYAEASGSGTSKTIAMLIGTPGLKTEFQLDSNVVRGMLKFNSSIAIAVCGNSVHTVNEALTLVPVIGLIGAGTTPVSMASNGQVVMLVDGSSTYYVIDPVAATITAHTDPAFTGADVVWFIKGRFVWNRPGTQIYQWSELYSTTIDPLSFASAEGAPDLLVSLIALNNELLLLGENSTEFHINSGDADAVFEPIQGAFIEQGCAAKFSVAKMTDGTGVGTAIWLSRNESGQGMFVKLVGYQPQRISDHALEYAIAQYSRIDDAVSYTYQQEGHSFYVCSFPTANKTWVYDTSTELWHERGQRDFLTGTTFGRHWSNCHMFFGGKNLVGDYFGARVFSFDLDQPYDFASTYAIHAIRQCPHLTDNNDWQFFDELWIDMETGVGLIANDPVTGVGQDPSLILEWSDDGGHTFPYSRLVKIGKIGERNYRAVARRLGKSRDRVFRVTVTDPVKRVFLGAGTRRRAA